MMLTPRTYRYPPGIQCSWFLCRLYNWVYVGERCHQSLLLSSWVRRIKGNSTWIASYLWSSRSPSFRTCQSCSLSSYWLYTRLLGLGSKLYPCNMLGIYPPFSYTNLTILILDECKFLKNGNKFVITLLIISGNKYFDLSENMVYLYKQIHPTKVGWMYFLTSQSFFL